MILLNLHFLALHSVAILLTQLWISFNYILSRSLHFLVISDMITNIYSINVYTTIAAIWFFHYVLWLRFSLRRNNSLIFYFKSFINMWIIYQPTAKFLLFLSFSLIAMEFTFVRKISNKIFARLFFLFKTSFI